jgi:hypothetical protein
MPVVAGGSGAAGGRVAWSGDWPFTLYILHSISWVSSTLAVLFLWLSWLVAAVRLVGGGVPSGPSTWPFTLFIHLFLLPACSISFVAKRMEMGPNGSATMPCAQRTI